MAMTLDQQRALAIADAKRRMAAETQVHRVAMPNLTGIPFVGPVLGLAGYDGRVVENPSMVPALDPINAAGAKLAESLPIVGPSLAAFGNQVDARFASMIEGREVAPEERAVITERDQQRFPVAATAGEVAGVVAPFAAAGATQLGAKALGMTGPLWQRVAAGGLTGSVITGADTAARGGDGQDVAVNTLVGGGIGAAFPLVEKGVSAVARAMLANNSSRAAQTIAAGMDRDRIDRHRHAN